MSATVLPTEEKPAPVAERSLHPAFYIAFVSRLDTRSASVAY